MVVVVMDYGGGDVRRLKTIREFLLIQGWVLKEHAAYTMNFFFFYFFKKKKKKE